MSQRTHIPKGMLRSGAIITRAGENEYSRSEIGLPGDSTVIVDRTIETLAGPDKPASLRGAPITLGHPPAGVTPDNFKAEVISAVSGKPVLQASVITGDVFIGHREALNEGIKELSIGYDVCP